jgi:hypothetical protein
MMNAQQTQVRNNAMATQFPSTITANGQIYTCTVWAKVAGKERVYIKTTAGKECLYYAIETDTFINQRTWGAAGQQQRVEAAFRAALVSTAPLDELRTLPVSGAVITHAQQRHCDSIRAQHATELDDSELLTSYLYNHDL